MTSSIRDATSSDIADYNAFVTGVANTVLTVVPEPGTAPLLALGLAIVGGRRRRRS